jgi:hypothetical protein
MLQLAGEQAKKDLTKMRDTGETDMRRQRRVVLAATVGFWADATTVLCHTWYA